MKITIVTVCYNSEKTISKTIESVIGQTYRDIEYIIIDGASKDRTVEIVNKYREKHNIVLVSEPDTGLYDAMNKAIVIANGKYILFMNSGDIFADEHVVQKMSTYLESEEDIIYGNVIRCRKSGEYLEKYHGNNIEIRLILSGKMMCHQSMFIKTTLMKEYGYDTEYSITADYDFVVRALKNKKAFKYVKDITVSKVESIEGISSLIINMDKMREQDDRSLKKNFPMLYAMITPAKLAVRFFKRMSEKKYNENSNNSNTNI